MSEVCTTEKAIILTRLKIFTKKELSEELGITRPTLDARISERSKWKKLEEKWINYLYTEEVLK